MIGTVALATAASLAGPARAADRAQLACVSEQLSPAERAAWRASADRLAASTIKDDLAPPPALIRALTVAAASCGERHRWSGQARADAVGIAQQGFNIPAVRARLTSLGGDPAAVDAALASLSRNDRDAFLAETAQGDAALAQALKAHGLPVDEHHPVGLCVKRLAILTLTRDFQLEQFAQE